VGARARRAAVALNASAADEGSDARVQLLADVRGVFEEQHADKLASERIVARLVELETRPWAEWQRGKPLTATGLAKLLKPFAIRPKQVWMNGANLHGYERGDFADAWGRYLPAGDDASKPLDALERAPGAVLNVRSHPLDAGSSSGWEDAEEPCATGVLAYLAGNNGTLHRDACDDADCRGCAPEASV
jgi:hypothetical protein